MGRKDPVNLYYSFTLYLGIRCVGQAGGYDVASPDVMESLVKYGPFGI